jgi:putative acyl-CoA dehydrogenase
LYIQQLKNKLGNRANASAEVEFKCAYAEMLGEPGRGIATILKMVALTRFDCVVGSAALMRQAVTQAIHFARYRAAFGQVLVDQPLMKNVLADLALESEAALVLGLRLATALDEAASQPTEKAWLRLATPVAKYWVCKRAPGHVYEAMECLGGQGYVENTVLPRLYREAPVNSIWEGSGNIQCLDVLRVIQESPEALTALLDELKRAQGANRFYDAFLQQVEFLLVRLPQETGLARQLVEKLALALQAALLLQQDNDLIGDAFCQARLQPETGLLYGALPAGIKLREIIDRSALI